MVFTNFTVVSHIKIFWLMINWLYTWQRFHKIIMGRISSEKWKDMWFRRILFSLTGTISEGLGNRFPLTPSTSVLSAQVMFQSVSHWLVQAQRILSPVGGLCSPPRSSMVVFWEQCYKFFVEELRSCRTQVDRTYLTRSSTPPPLQ